MPRISPDEKREKLLKERGKLDAQLRALDAQQRDTQRKRDTRRKVIAGAIALEHLERFENDPFSVKLRELLHTYVEARSRDLFPFLPANKDRPAETSPAKGTINLAKDEIVNPAKPGPEKDRSEQEALEPEKVQQARQALRYSNEYQGSRRFNGACLVKNIVGNLPFTRHCQASRSLNCSTKPAEKSWNI